MLQDMSSARQTWGVRLRKDEVNDQSKKKKSGDKGLKFSGLEKMTFCWSKHNNNRNNTKRN